MLPAQCAQHTHTLTQATATQRGTRTPPHKVGELGGALLTRLLEQLHQVAHLTVPRLPLRRRRGRGAGVARVVGRAATDEDARQRHQVDQRLGVAQA